MMKMETTTKGVVAGGRGEDGMEWGDKCGNGHDSMVGRAGEQARGLDPRCVGLRFFFAYKVHISLNPIVSNVDTCSLRPASAA